MQENILTPEEIATHLSPAAMLEACITGVWCMYSNIETEHYMLYTDNTVLSLLGLHAQSTPEIYYEYIISHILSKDVAYVRKAFEDAYSLHTVQEIEYLWQHPQRGIVTVRAVFAAVPSIKEGYRCLKGSMHILDTVRIMPSARHKEREAMDIIFNATPLGAILLDEHGIPIDCNAALLNMLCLENKEEYCKNFRDFSPKCQADPVLFARDRKRNCQEALLNGGITFERLYQKANTAEGKGEIFSAEVTLVSTRYDDKNVLTAFVRDLTEERAAQEKIQKERESARILFDLAPMAAIFWSKENRPIDCNPAMLEMFDVEDKEYFLSNIYDFVPEKQPDGMHSIIKRNHYVAETFAHGSCQFEWVFKRAKNTKDRPEYFHTENLFKRTLYEGKPALISFVRELTKERAAQKHIQEQRERIDAMFFASPIGAILWNIKGEPIECNPAMLQMCGVATNEEYCRNFRNYLPEKQPNGVDSLVQRAEYIQEAYAKGFCKFEWLYKKKAKVAEKGELLLTEVTLIPTQYAGDTVLVAFTRDITEEKAMMQRLAQQKEELHHTLLEAKQAGEAKNNFFTNVSHEIRTPMNAILGMSHLCLQKDIDDQVRDYIEKINTAGKDLLDIINNILDISKVESGKFTLEHAPFSVTEVLKHVRDIVRTLAHDKPIEVLFNIDPTLPTRFMGDSMRLRQVFINIAGNAIKFMEKGYLLISVSAVERKGDTYTLCIQIIDTGIGMNKDRLEAIFRPFEQADNTTTRRFGGTGLGLTIAKNIVECMDGNITVHSEVNKGTTFDIRIPLPVYEENTWLNTRIAQNKNILVVDDNSMAARVLKDVLMKCGFTAEFTTTPHEAFRKITEAEHTAKPYDIVIVDWHMPDMDGFETVQKVRDLPLQNMPIFLLTSIYAIDTLDADKIAVFAGFLPKPILPSLLWKEIMRALQYPIANDDKEQLSEHVRADIVHKRKEVKLHGVHMLVAEDNAINQEIIRALLEDKGIVLTVVNNGQEAINICQKERFACIFMDIQMPVMDGLTATRHIRGLEGFDEASVPIIAMTAHAMLMHKEQSKEAGMNAHISKPIDPAELDDILVEWVGQYLS